MNWILCSFDELTPHQLYAILRLRSEVFVVEQQCVFLDADDKDQSSHHLMCFEDALLIAYTRLVPPRISYDEPSIGRVVTAPSVRRSGTGRELMRRSIDAVRQLYGETPIRIGAQLYLKTFYMSFGFVQVGDVYLEDGIEHIYMIKAVG